MRACACLIRVCPLPRGHLEQRLDLRTEIRGNRESCLITVGSDEARDRVVGQVHSIGASLIGWLPVRTMLRRERSWPSPSNERITDDETDDLGPLSASFLTQNFAGVKADDLHQIRGSDRPLNHLFQIGNGPCRSNRAVEPRSCLDGQ
jgi:hypothetical protein